MQRSVPCSVMPEWAWGVPALPPSLLPPSQRTLQQCPASDPSRAAPAAGAAVPPVPAGCVASTVHGRMLALLSISTSVALTCSISSSRRGVAGGCAGPPPRRLPLRLGSPWLPSPVRSRVVPPPCTEKSWQRWWAWRRSCRKSSRAERKSTHSLSSSRRSSGLADACRSPASSVCCSPVG